MMRIAVSSENDEGLSSPVSQHFGRCPFYTLVDLEGSRIKGVKAVSNPFLHVHHPGEVPRFIRGHKADVIISGGMGQRAISLFSEARIDVITGASGTVSAAILEYLDGRLRGAAGCLDSLEHHRQGAGGRHRC